MSEFFVLPVLALGLLVVAVPVLLAVTAVNTWGLRRRVRALEERLSGLERRGAAPAPAAPRETAPSVGPTPEREDQAAPAAPLAVAEPAAAGTAGPGGGEAPPAPPAGDNASAGSPGSTLGVPADPTRVAGAPPADRPRSPADATLRGGAWLSRAGALLLVLGAVFFLQHAVEREWIGPGMRLVLGVAAGVAGLVLGERLHRTARVPAQGLVAAAIGVLLVTGYAAHVRYELVGLPATLAAMAAVMAWAARFAIRQDARAVAFLAAAGGYLAPLFLEAGPGAALALLAYLALVDAGWLVVALKRRWGELLALAFLLTQGLLGQWLEDAYRPEALSVALPAATLILLLFAQAGALDLLRRTATGGPPGLVGPLVVAATPTAYLLAAREMLGPGRTRELALLAAGLGLAYLAAGRLLRRGAGLAALPGALHTAVGLGLVTAALAVRLSGTTLVMAWSVEGLALVVAGVRLELLRLRLSGLAVLGLAVLRWLDVLRGDAGGAGLFLVAHPAFPALAVMAGALLAAALAWRPPVPGVGVRWLDAAARPLLVLAASGTAAHLVVTELGLFRTLWVPPPYVGVLDTAVWALVALPLLALARGDHTRVALVAATVVLVGAGFAAVTDDAVAWSRVQVHLRPVVGNPRFLAGLLIVVLYGLYARLAPELPSLAPAAGARLGSLAGAATLLFLLWHLSAEAWLAPLPSLPPADAAQWRGAAVSVLWTLYAFGLLALGLRRERPGLRGGAFLLFGITVGKVLLVDLAALGAGYRVLSVLALGAVLLLASFAYTRTRRSPPGPAGPPGPRGASPS